MAIGRTMSTSNESKMATHTASCGKMNVCSGGNGKRLNCVCGCAHNQIRRTNIMISVHRGCFKIFVNEMVVI